MTQMIPSAFANKNIKLVIGPGSSFDLETINKEIKMLDDAGFDISSRLVIHPNAMIIEQQDKDREKELLKTGSTFKGCGAAMARKIMRLPDVKLAKDVKDQIIGGKVYDYIEEVHECLSKDGDVLIEGAQGFGLSISFAEYPYTTSRNCHPGQLVADCGIPMKFVKHIIANIRPYPIRISNTSAADGSQVYSGGYAESKELTWEEVEKRAGFAPGELSGHHSNYTSVTKKLRRVFEFSWQRFRYMNKVCAPTSLSLNFANHLDKSVAGKNDYMDIMCNHSVVRDFADRLAMESGVNVDFIGTGAKMSEMAVRNGCKVLEVSKMS